MISKALAMYGSKKILECNSDESIRLFIGYLIHHILDVSFYSLGEVAIFCNKYIDFV